MNNFVKRLITSIFLITIFQTVFFCFPPLILSAILALELLYILAIEWPPLCKPKSLWLLTPLYPTAPFLILIYLNHYHHSVLFALIMLVAIFDSSSYLFGKLLGKHKIAPQISAGKTWEGFLAGSCTTVLLGTWLMTSSDNFLIAFVCCGICVSSLCGDLFESYLKRRVGKKDSGSILPGHGGLLDRMDGLMFAGIWTILWVSLILPVLAEFH